MCIYVCVSYSFISAVITLSAAFLECYVAISLLSPSLFVCCSHSHSHAPLLPAANPSVILALSFRNESLFFIAIMCSVVTRVLLSKPNSRYTTTTITITTALAVLSHPFPRSYIHPSVHSFIQSFPRIYLCITSFYKYVVCRCAQNQNSQSSQSAPRSLQSTIDTFVPSSFVSGLSYHSPCFYASASCFYYTRFNILS